jgi:hypothetical protein
MFISKLMDLLFCFPKKLVFVQLTVIRVLKNSTDLCFETSIDFLIANTSVVDEVLELVDLFAFPLLEFDSV